MNRGQDYRPGDLIVFFHGPERQLTAQQEIGWIIRRDCDDMMNPAVLVGFPYSTNEYHYYDLELQAWEKAGVIEVKRG